jgi:hypothetical protein
MWERNAQQVQQGQYETAQQNIDINLVDADLVNAYVARVFGWMFVGLLVTAVTTVAIVWGIENSAAFANAVDMTLYSYLFLFIAFAQLGLVWAITGRVAKMNPGVSKFLFLLYAAMNGLTFGFVVLVFAYGVFANPMATVGMAFGITAVSFGVMAVYGLVTRTDLTRFGNLFFMGLIGLIIASVANWFVGGAMLDLVVIVGGLFLFMGLTAYHTNTIKHHYAQVALSDNGAMAIGAEIDQEALASNLAIRGALSLYLAFINMFWFILRILARMRR